MEKQETLLGVLGWPVHHSLSPSMMNRALEHVGINGHYHAFAVPPERISDAVKGLQALGALGVNVTIPHKQAVLRVVHHRTEEAELAHAINTLKFDTERYEVTGHNTDVTGWWDSIANHVTADFKRAVIIGAGGGARAVIAALSLFRPQLHVTVSARDEQKSALLVQDFADKLDCETTDWTNRHKAIHQADLIVNTTPVGMWPNVDATPVEDETCFHPQQVVQDIVYRPLKTRLMEMAERQGAQVVDGLNMLVYQGAKAFEFWTGHPAPVELMREALLAQL